MSWNGRTLRDLHHLQLLHEQRDGKILSDRVAQTKNDEARLASLTQELTEAEVQLDKATNGPIINLSAMRIAASNLGRVETRRSQAVRDCEDSHAAQETAEKDWSLARCRSEHLAQMASYAERREIIRADEKAQRETSSLHIIRKEWCR